MAVSNMKSERSKSNRLVSADDLRAAVHYDPETGRFIRISSWQNTSKPGTLLNHQSGGGYITFSINGRMDYGHRWAWLYMTGSLPSAGMHLDHINGDRADNQFSNLRLATAPQNCANARKSASNKSGYKGVSMHRARWRAAITINRKQKFLGYYTTPAEAAAAYARAANELHGEFARLS
jgi:hypothetical protein